MDRPLIQGECGLARLLDAAGDAIAVERTHLVKRLEDHEIQRALKDG
jgi:hypothetical protein